MAEPSVRVGRRGWHPRHVGDLLALGIALLVLGLISVVIESDAVPAIEADVFEAFNEPDWLPYRVVWLPMQLGSVAAIPLTVALACAYRRWRLALALGVSGLAAWWVAKLVKALVDRGRPVALLDGVDLRGSSDGATGLGYVSGHAAVAAALATAAWPFLPRRWRVLSAVLVVVVAAGRVHVGAHLPLDVVGGACLGVALAALTHLVGISPANAHRARRQGADAGAADGVPA